MNLFADLLRPPTGPTLLDRKPRDEVAFYALMSIYVGSDELFSVLAEIELEDRDVDAFLYRQSRLRTQTGETIH
jgi:hypothetical protein